jgi:lysozyme family protein
MDQFKDIALPLVLVFEGPTFTIHPNDKGGPTRYGIIQTVYDTYRTNKSLATQSVKDITLQEVQDIYYVGYWVSAKCQDMPGKLSIAVFDTTVNSGKGRSIKILQQAIGATVDGIIGQETLQKLKNLNENEVANKYIDTRESFYHAIVDHDLSQSAFLNGWLRRAKFLRDYINGDKTLEQIKKEW